MPDLLAPPADVALVRRNALRALIDPAWRYHRAKDLKTDGVRNFSSTEDVDVVELTRFLTVYSPAKAADIPAIEAKYPDVTWAFRVYSNAYSGPRFHLEALVITGMPTEEIADYLGIPTEVVATYERMFFDLRQHLERPGAIRTLIHARAKSRGLRDLDPDVLWKQIALAEGAAMLTSLWDGGTMEPAQLKHMDSLVASQMRRNAVEASRCREVSPLNANDIMLEYTALLKLEMDARRAEAEVGAPTGTSGEFMSSLINSVQFVVAPIGQASEQAYLEVAGAAMQAEQLLKRLQGAAAEKTANVDDAKAGD